MSSLEKKASHSNSVSLVRKNAVAQQQYITYSTVLSSKDLNYLTKGLGQAIEYKYGLRAKARGSSGLQACDFGVTLHSECRCQL